MLIFKKIKEVSLPLIPITIICLLVHFFAFRFSTNLLVMFLISVVLLILGEALFLFGVDSSIIKMGEIVGESTHESSKFYILIIFAFIFGLFATIAEPDASVLAEKVSQLGIPINPFLFVFIMGAGVGILVSVALLRIILQVPLKVLIGFLIVISGIICFFVEKKVIAIALDAGGASTGVITSPFLIALAGGLSLSRTQNDKKGDFGVVGIASFGPVIAILFYFLIKRMGLTGSLTSLDSDGDFITILLDSLKTAILSIAPLFVFFFIYEIIFVKLPKQKVRGLVFASLLVFVGLFIFLFGIDFGVSKMGHALGEAFTTFPHWIVILLCGSMGFIIAFSEPAVKILGEQVERLTAGHIRASVCLTTIAVSMFIAVGINAFRIIYDVPYVWVMAVLYGLALILLFINDSMFVGIAFDSGGVASGPISAAFIMPLMIGLASSSLGFGVIGLVAVMPVVAIEMLGLIYRIELKIIKKNELKNAQRLKRYHDQLNDMDELIKISRRAKRRENNGINKA